MTLEEQKKIVFEARLVLHQVILEHGSETLKTYLQGHQVHSSVNSEESVNDKVADDQDKKKEFLEVFEQKAEQVFGKGLASQAVAQLEKDFFVSTADHHGPITHPFFLNANLLLGTSNFSKGLKSNIVLACAGTSLNNSSFPRGLLYTDGLKQKHLPIFSLKYKHAPVYGLRPYNIGEVMNLQKETQKFNPLLSQTIDSIYSSLDVLGAPSYSDQISKTNLKLWHLLPGQEKVNLIYLSQEEIVAELIIKYHLEKPTEIHNLLFNDLWQQKFLEHFKGISGAFAEEKGTFLFWGIRDGKRIRFEKDGQQLVSVDNPEYGINISPDSLAKGLMSKRLMPSMALSFIVLAFYYGLKCGGGFSQVDYLTSMKAAYKKMLIDLKQPRKINVQTNFFAADFGLKSAESYQSTSIDLLLSKSYNTFVENLKNNFETLTLSESFDLMVPEFYKIITASKLK